MVKKEIVMCCLIIIFVTLFIFWPTDFDFKQPKIRSSFTASNNQTSKVYPKRHNPTLSSFYVSNIFNTYHCDEEWISFVVPYRKREEHLPYFLKAIHKQQKNHSQTNVSFDFSFIIDFLHPFGFQYDIFIVEQDDDSPFNRAKLVNIGATLASLQYLEKCSQIGKNLCIICHDIDMLPMNIKLYYTCLESPKLYATAAEQFEFKVRL